MEMSKRRSLIIFCNSGFVFEKFLAPLVYAIGLELKIPIIVVGDFREFTGNIATNQVDIKFLNVKYLRKYLISFAEICKTLKILFSSDGCVVCTNPKPAFLVTLLCFLIKRKSIFLCQGLVSNSISESQFNFKKIIDFVPIAFSDKVVAISPPLAEEIRNIKKNCNLVMLSPGSVSGTQCLKVRVPRPIGDKLRLIYFGRIAKDKNIEFLKKVVETLEKRGQSVELRIYGPIDDRKIFNSVKGFSKYSGVSKDLWSVALSSDFLLSPSLREGLGMSVIESLCMGLPVIVSDIPPHSYALGYLRNSLALPLEADLWAERLISLAGQPESYIKVCRDAHDVAFKFERSNVISSNLTLLEHELFAV